MRALLFSLALVAIFAVGCKEPTSNVTPVVVEKKPKAAAAVAEDGMAFEEVNAEGLESTLATNNVTLIEFTADW